MDTSETYIKMCEKAEEIQFLRRELRHHPTGKWQIGDFWTHITFPSNIFVVYKNDDAWVDEPEYLHHPSECIWLPRQDQLQEMIGEIEYWEIRSYPKLGRMDTSKPFELVIPGRNYDLTAATMEQLWLAFVMSERYNKVWAGTGWIKKEVIYA